MLPSQLRSPGGIAMGGRIGQERFDLGGSRESGGEPFAEVQSFLRRRAAS
jgi:hypothetical protein